MNSYRLWKGLREEACCTKEEALWIILDEIYRFESFDPEFHHLIDDFQLILKNRMRRNRKSL